MKRARDWYPSYSKRRRGNASAPYGGGWTPSSSSSSSSAGGVYFGPPKPARKRRTTYARTRYTRRKFVLPRLQFQRSTYLAPALRGLGGLAGTYLGGPALAPIGMSIGEALGHGIKTLTGFGDYEVKSNTLAPGAPPSVANGAIPGGAVMISFKEYLGDVVSSSSANTFDVKSYAINPGNSKTFPWLSQVAGNFLQYRVMGMVFQYRTMSADALNSTNTALGSVVMATDYDALSSAFASKAEMENNAYSQSVKPSESCLHLIECDTSTLPISELYVRTGSVPSGADARMYDLGNFQIATTGFQGTSVNCGELWVSYQIMLLKPKLYDALGNDVAFYGIYNDTGIANATPVGTISNLMELPFDGAVDVNNLGITVDGSGVFTIPGEANPKTYEVYCLWYGDRTASLASPGIAYGNCTLGVKHWPLSSVPAYSGAAFQCPDNNVASLSNVLISQFVLRTNGGGVDATFSLQAGGTLPANCTFMYIKVQEIPNDSMNYDS